MPRRKRVSELVGPTKPEVRAQTVSAGGGNHCTDPQEAYDRMIREQEASRRECREIAERHGCLRDPAADLLREAAEVEIEWSREVRAAHYVQRQTFGGAARIYFSEGGCRWAIDGRDGSAPTEADAWAAVEAQLRLDLVLRRRAGR